MKNKEIKIIFNPKYPDARYVKPYKAYCGIHHRNCTQYNCKYVKRKVEEHFKLKPTRHIPLKKNLLEQSRLKRSLSLLDKKGGLLLDVGCGSAEYHNFIRNYRIIGLEASRECVLSARKSNSKHKYILGDVTAISSFKKERFDAITCFEVLEHIPLRKVNYLLKQIYRCLKKDGIFLLSVPNKYYPDVFLGSTLGKFSPVGFSRTHFRNYTMPGLKKLLGQYNFKVEQIKGHHLFIPFLAKLLGDRRAVKLKSFLSWNHPLFSETLIVKARK